MRHTWLCMMTCFLWGCGACEGGSAPPPPARLEDPSACVPLEQRDACQISEKGILVLSSTEDLERVCQSTCKTVPLLKVGGEVADLSVLDFIEFPEGSVIISIGGTSALTSLKELGRYEVIADLRITSTTGLRSLEGLENVRHVGTLELRSNADLESLDGLQGLDIAGTTDPFGEGLQISDNPKLRTLDGVQNLREAETLTILNNPQLESAAALGSLEYVDRGMDIIDNGRLRDLPDGALKRFRGINPSEITNNRSLAPCRIKAFLSGVKEEPYIPLVIAANGTDSPELCD